MDEGTLIMCGLEPQRVLDAIDVVTRQRQAGAGSARIVQDYDTDNVSQKVVRIILSYTDYVNRVVCGNFRTENSDVRADDAVLVTGQRLRRRRSVRAAG